MFLKAKVKELQEVKHEELANEKKPIGKDEEKKTDLGKENVSEFELIPIGRIE